MIDTILIEIAISRVQFSVWWCWYRLKGIRKNKYCSRILFYSVCYIFYDLASVMIKLKDSVVIFELKDLFEIINTKYYL